MESELSLFSGDGSARKWLIELLFFCWANQIGYEQQLSVALQHLDGEAFEWVYQKKWQVFDWTHFKAALQQDFGEGKMSDVNSVVTTHRMEVEAKRDDDESNNYAENCKAMKLGGVRRPLAVARNVPSRTWRRKQKVESIIRTIFRKFEFDPYTVATGEGALGTQNSARYKDSVLGRAIRRRRLGGKMGCAARAPAKPPWMWTEAAVEVADLLQIRRWRRPWATEVRTQGMVLIQFPLEEDLQDSFSRLESMARFEEYFLGLNTTQEREGGGSPSAAAFEEKPRVSIVSFFPIEEDLQDWNIRLDLIAKSFDYFLGLTTALKRKEILQSAAVEIVDKFQIRHRQELYGKILIQFPIEMDLQDLFTQLYFMAKSFEYCLGLSITPKRKEKSQSAARKERNCLVFLDFRQKLCATLVRLNDEFFPLWKDLQDLDTQLYLMAKSQEYIFGFSRRQDRQEGSQSAASRERNM